MSKKDEDEDLVKEAEEFYEESIEKGENDESLIDVESISLKDIPGLGDKTAKILEENNITNVDQIMTTSLLELQSMGVKRATAKKIREAIKKMVPKYKYFKEEINLEDIPGIGGKTAETLREKGLNVYLIETTPIRELEEKYGITAAAAQKYKEALKELRGGIEFVNALDVLEKQKSILSFTYGVKNIDALTTIDELGVSGVRLGETIELFGPFRSGKSQLCHQLCVTVQLPIELGGAGKKAVFIDTEGTFSPSRIKAIHERFQRELGWKKSFEDVLKDISYARAYNSDHQMTLSERLLELFFNQKDEYGLVVVDSATAHFRAEYAGRGTLAERQQTMNYHLGILGRIADTYNVAVVITNQVQSNPGAFFGDPTQAIGGNIMGHWATTRFYLRKSKGEKRIIRVYDSPVLPESEAIFAITPEGCVDAE
ncbi:MAG: DNA repair and recombination protein RadA [Candidatus Heimdallarchaeum endolithica]|uniref:DNA repair and recombination protein RadA n=1 Tax=Candidatus Heimdallarchaeum endolithica TaxID=2876572 RepID=A0A9Y1BNS4_9ARCH|nr:MAG: DNA repair and recombination protein RadA [Candidatus Heimdallarchaeum endolithica]